VARGIFGKGKESGLKEDKDGIEEVIVRRG